MPRRVTLPSADDLFRPTAQRGEGAARPVAAVPDPTDAPAEAADPSSGSRRSSGRVRHDEKMTVYVTADELLGLEHARLDLRRDHGLAVDRGRLVREAIAIVLADLDLNGEDSVLVQRLAPR
ncbi:MAG TPA: hypothetical protein VFM09_07150 [Marmoricola sp.]|nr:hypothetical protein [Marmoricola sp.]